MRDRKLVESRQRSLSSRFILPRCERPLLAGKEKHSQQKNFNVSFPLFNMEGNQTRVTGSSDSDIKKLMASAVPESTKKSPKNAINVFEDEENHE